MRLVNIHNHFSTIYTFCRDSNGKLEISVDDKFRPFFYELDEKGYYKSNDGKSLRKVICGAPHEVPKMRSIDSYASDVRYPINYMIKKVNTIEKCPVKYFFIDVEMITDILPNYKDPIKEISCISLYNSFTKEITTWYIKDYKNTGESGLIEDFVDYIQMEKPDLILAWNVDFDYNYLYTRYNRLTGKNFATDISPISKYRYSSNHKGDRDILYPAGISILDYLGLFKKIHSKEPSYALDRVAQNHLDEKSWGKTDFSESSSHVKEKNINDVRRMVKLEDKYGIIDYYNEIRIYSKCLWEDLIFNSRVIDCVVLNEANKKNIILPRKRTDLESESFQGAYRRADIGVFENIYKADVGSMYPSQLINFCLDPSNIVYKENSNLIINKVDKTLFKQDSNAILPTVARNLVTQKNILKEKLNKLDENSGEHKLLKQKYDAYKGLVNSLYGVTALTSFRLYDNRVASGITFLARELLHYVEDKMKEAGHEVIYVDTDSIFYKSNKDEIKWLNQLVLDWGHTYNKEVNIIFESEGKFTKLLSLGRCHYYGYIEGKTKPEIKGIEMKRSSSSKYEAKFQEELIEMILNKETKDKILNWIEYEKERIKLLPLQEVGFPCKRNTKQYKKIPIFLRAYENTNKFKSFNVNSGDLYYYIFVNSFGKKTNVMAFNEEINDHLSNSDIDWNEVERRSILSKATAIFEALGWDTLELHDQTVLF